MVKQQIQIEMHLFQSIQIPFANLGIYPEPKKLINVKNTVAFLFFSQYTISIAVYFLYEAKTTQEFSESFYILATTTLLFFIFTIYIYKRQIFFQLIDDLRRIIETRELKCLMNSLHLCIYQIQ